MKTLIIDNYDSFTYNLYQLIAQVGGEAPAVVLNDDPSFRLEDLERFDAVVISPGPGHPGNASDFGIAAGIAASSRVPLLGVCLGHQGLCLLAGAAVGPAPQVYHGRRSPVLHDGRGLFAGIPSPFQVVRYHSLAVTNLPDSLEAIGRTPDGVLMAVRHRHRPAWGVQFHPESIDTEHGAALMANFLRLAQQWGGRAGQGVRPNEVKRDYCIYANISGPDLSSSGPDAERNPSARRSGRKLTLVARRLELDVDPERVFDDMFSRCADAFWLDSSLAHPVLGRWSFMGASFGPLGRTVTARVPDGTVTVAGPSGTCTVRSGFFDWLEADLSSCEVEAPDLPFAFALGWVGYLGYELKAECGGASVHASGAPDACLLFADRAIAFDRLGRGVYLLALVEAEAPRTEVDTWLEETAAKLAELSAGGKRPASPGGSSSAAKEAPKGGELRLRHDRNAYLALIERCQAHIRSGESYEICLTNMLSARAAVDPWTAYRVLRAANPSPFAAYLRHGDLDVLSTSPERFLCRDAGGTLESRPIKGTRPRGATPAEDEALARELAASEKERAENLMIVDLVRNDLGRVAEVGSVRVPVLCGVESYATVHQLVSVIRARTRASAARCIRAAFPGGSMTGAPKIRTMAILDALEGGARGIYSGALGYISPTGALDLSIVIRTAVLQGENFCYGSGGAVTALSDPAEEFQETAVKAMPLLRLLGLEFTGCPGGEPAGDGGRA